MSIENLPTLLALAGRPPRGFDQSPTFGVAGAFFLSFLAFFGGIALRRGTPRHAVCLAPSSDLPREGTPRASALASPRLRRAPWRAQMGRRIQARIRLRAQTRGHANSLVRRRRRPGAEMSGNASPAREAGGSERACARPAANRARVRSPQPDEGTAARQLTETQSGEGTASPGRALSSCELSSCDLVLSTPALSRRAISVLKS